MGYISDLKMDTINNSPLVHAVILSGGEGTRFDSELPKQYVKLAGKTILEHSIDAYEINPDIDSIIIVVSENFLDLVKEIIQDNSYKKITNILIGGKSRIESSYCAIQSLSDDNDIIILHDAVRPLVSQKTISDNVAALKFNDASETVIPCTDTMIETIDSNFIKSMPARACLRRVSGPSGFRLGLLRKAHLMAIADQNTDHTCDSSLVLNYKLTVIYIVLGNTDNIKVTYPEDLIIAETLLMLKRNC